MRRRWMHKKRMLNRTLAAVLLGLLALSVTVSNQPGANTANAAAKPGSLPAKAVSDNKSLVFRVYFRNNAERDNLAVELGAEEASTTAGYLTVWSDNDT